MSRENVEVVVGQFEGVNRREFAAVMDAYADDVTLVLRGDHARVTGADVVTGKEAVGEWFGDWFRQFAPDYRFEVEETRDLGDRVFLVARHYGRGRVSGASVSDSTAYLYTVRGGKVSRVEAWDDREDALEAAGLAERTPAADIQERTWPNAAGIVGVTVGLIGIYFGVAEPIIFHERTLAFGGIALVAGLIGYWNSRNDPRLQQRIAVGAIVVGGIALLLGYEQYNEFQDNINRLNEGLENLDRFLGR